MELNEGEVTMLLAVSLAVVLGVPILLYFLSRRNYWSRRGVCEERGKPFIGSYGPILTQSATLFDIARKIYRDYPDEPFVGMYEFNKPILLVRDPQLVNDVLVKEFPNFTDNGFQIDSKLDPLVSRNPFFLNGEKWKSTRTTLLPAFSSGRLRSLLQPIDGICEELLEYVSKEAPNAPPGGLDVKELTARFTTEVVSSIALGVRANSFEDVNAEIRRMGRRLMQPEGLHVYFLTLNLIFPFMRWIIPTRFVALDVDKFFRNLIQESVDYREKNGIQRNDFLQVLLSLKEKAKMSGQHYGNEDITAHAVTFFTDGFETSSTALAFLLHDLAGNVDAQNRLREEVSKIKELEDILKCRFLDACLMETLRLHPPAALLKKKCTKQTVLRAGGKEVGIEKGMDVMLPVWGIHTDPQFFSDPEVFLPERFLDTEPPKGVFVPFGDGPRQCIGMRFAQMQVKLGAAKLIRNFEIQRTPKSPPDPVEQDPTIFFLTAKGGLWLNFIPLKA